MSDDHTVQLHLLVHTQHERSAVLPLCSLPKKIKNKKWKHRAANIQKTPEPEAGVIKENKCFWTQEKGGGESLTIYTANKHKL